MTLGTIEKFTPVNEEEFDNHFVIKEQTDFWKIFFKVSESLSVDAIQKQCFQKSYRATHQRKRKQNHRNKSKSTP